MNSVFIIGIFLSCFMHVLLITKKKKEASDVVLGAWMLIIGIHLFSYYIYRLGYWEKYPDLIGITNPFPLLHGPMLYLYVAFALRKQQKPKWQDFLHFIPFASAYIYMLIFFFFIPTEQKVLVDHNQLHDYDFFMNLSLISFLLSGIAYPILAYRLLGKHQRLITQNYSYDEHFSMNWLKYLIGGIGLVYITVAFFSFVKEILHYTYAFNTDLIFYTETILIILFLGYYGIKRQGLFVDKSKSEWVIEEELSNSGSAAEYRKSGLKPEEAMLLHQRLLKLMMERKLYLEPKLTLGDLSNELDISVNNVSQLINQYQGKNFYDFVNEYRVNEFKERTSLPQYKHLNILALALDSGFNSKSAFNLIFKKHTGKTPSQYMAEIR